jgi:hypothetical protein
MLLKSGQGFHPQRLGRAKIQAQLTEQLQNKTTDTKKAAYCQAAFSIIWQLSAQINLQLQLAQLQILMHCVEELRLGYLARRKQDY